MTNVEVKVSEFTTLPGGRFIEEGDGSAEEFFKVYISPKLRGPKATILSIDMTGTWGYPPSFTSQLGIYLKKYFGGVEKVIEHVKITIADPETFDRFWNQLEDDDEQEAN